MAQGILAPVPCVHLASAIATCAQHGRVAFGSNAVDVFERDLEPLPWAGCRVLIYGSRPELHGGEFKSFHRPGFVTYSATFVAWVRANPDGRHPDPQLRPISTQDNDTAVIGFWEVADLVRLATPIALTALTGKRGRLKVGFVPEGPMAIDGDDL